MKRNEDSQPAPGWVGGFATSTPAFAYPEPDLSTLLESTRDDHALPLAREPRTPGKGLGSPLCRRLDAELHRPIAQNALRLEYRVNVVAHTLGLMLIHDPRRSGCSICD